MKNHNHIERSNRRHEDRKRTVMVLLIMVLCPLGTDVQTSYASQEASQEASQAAAPDASQDISPETTGSIMGTIIIEYGNLRKLLKQGNLSLKESTEDYENNINACQEIWDTLEREQDNMKDKAEEMGGEDNQTARIYPSNVAILKSPTSHIYGQLDAMTSEKSARSLEGSTDIFTIVTQTLMNSYNQMVQNVEYQEKRAESLQVAFGTMVGKQTVGTTTQARLKEAEKSPDTVGNSLEPLRPRAGELRRRLLTILGIEDSGQVVIEAIPESDMATIEAVNYESDKNRAMGNDKNMQNARHTPASSTTEVDIRFRLADEAERTKEAVSLASYQNPQASKTAYEAALTTFQSARLTYEEPQRKQQAGLLTSTEYLEGQAAYLEKEVTKGTTSMNLTVTYESYRWGVKGISQMWYIWPESRQ